MRSRRDLRIREARLEHAAQRYQVAEREQVVRQIRRDDHGRPENDHRQPHERVPPGPRACTHAGETRSADGRPEKDGVETREHRCAEREPEHELATGMMLIEHAPADAEREEDDERGHKQRRFHAGRAGDLHEEYEEEARNKADARLVVPRLHPEDGDAGESEEQRLDHQHYPQQGFWSPLNDREQPHKRVRPEGLETVGPVDAVEGESLSSRDVPGHLEEVRRVVRHDADDPGEVGEDGHEDEIAERGAHQNRNERRSVRPAPRLPGGRRHGRLSHPETYSGGILITSKSEAMNSASPPA